MGGGVSNCPALEGEVPDRFDSREKWAQCFTSPIYNMGNCTASWAIATASALSNRFCIGSPSDYSELMLSPQELLSCDTMQRGCSGGDIDTAWNYLEREGLVSEICFPYQADGSVSCASKCSTEVPLKAASHCVLNNEMAIRREIFNHGPVVAPLFLVDDLLVYRGGLYTEMPTATQLSDARRQRIIHAVKIIGWGNMEGKNYWLIENSWGEDWGEHGYAKVLAGGDPEKREGIMIESYVLAGVPSNKKVAGAMDDTDADFDSDVDLEDIDVELDDDPEKAKEPDDDPDLA
jgi:cathepsin B